MHVVRVNGLFTPTRPKDAMLEMRRDGQRIRFARQSMSDWGKDEDHTASASSDCAFAFIGGTARAGICRRGDPT
jgi:hypothetical protein